MPLLTLLGMLLVVWIIGAKEKREMSSIQQSARSWEADWEDWCDRTVDPYLKSDIERFILSEENEAEVSALWEELAAVAPELDQCWPILYDSQFGRGVPKKVRSLAIGYNLMFLTPFMLAKKGKIPDGDGITFNHRILINQGTNLEIRRSKDAPWGLSNKSIISLNKWLEETMRAAGVSDARIIFLPNIHIKDKSIISGDFHWDKACVLRNFAYYKW